MHRKVFLYILINFNSNVQCNVPFKNAYACNIISFYFWIIIMENEKIILSFFYHSWDNMCIDYFYPDSARLDHFLFQTDIFLQTKVENTSAKSK